jgi:hypothetical protein
MVIHHVKMDEIGSGSDNGCNFIAQFGKVCGKNTWSNAIISHGQLPLWSKMGQRLHFNHK